MDLLPRNNIKVFIDQCLLWSVDYRRILGILLLNQQCLFILTKLIHLFVQELLPNFFNHIRLFYKLFGIEILTGTIVRIWSSQGTGKLWLFGIWNSKIVNFDYALLFWRWINLQIRNLAEINVIMVPPKFDTFIIFQDWVRQKLIWHVGIHIHKWPFAFLMPKRNWKICLLLTWVCDHTQAHQRSDSYATNSGKLVASSAYTAKRRNNRKSSWGLRIFITGLSLSFSYRLFIPLILIRLVFVFNTHIFLTDACQFFLGFWNPIY